MVGVMESIYDASIWFTAFVLNMTGFIFWLLLYLGLWSTSFIVRMIRDSLK